MEITFYTNIAVKDYKKQNMKNVMFKIHQKIRL